MKSEQINELATALAKAQAEMHGAKKDSKNPFFKSNYADLQSVWEACREALTRNGLSVVQIIMHTDLNTFLLHSSGQWMQSIYHLKPVKDDPQGMGSAISYARRYSLAAMVGVYQTDDDAENAQGRNKEPSTAYFDSIPPEDDDYAPTYTPSSPKPTEKPVAKTQPKTDNKEKEHFGPHIFNKQTGQCTIMKQDGKPCGERKL